jgi:membrane associated rhomboid family serine protease
MFVVITANKAQEFYSLIFWLFSFYPEVISVRNSAHAGGEICSILKIINRNVSGKLKVVNAYYLWIFSDTNYYVNIQM